MQASFVLVVLSLCQLQIALGGVRPGEAYDYEKFQDYVINKDDFLFVERNEITFRLWTRGQTKFEKISHDKLNEAVTFKPNKGVKFITHGYQSDANVDWVGNIRKAFLNKEDLNVVEVDWSGPAGNYWYPISARRTKAVGEYIGELIVALNVVRGVPYSNIHLVGHSLGSHVSGFAGKYVQKMTAKTVNRISGLDPAGPSFTLADPSDRLSNKDAEIVEAIHTDGGKYGFLEPIGTIDLFPNGGVSAQPGCYMLGVTDILACSHLRVTELFLESITSKGFEARKCANIGAYSNGLCATHEKIIMGDTVDKKVTGSFYLNTNSKAPYARFGQI